jgi:uncharacterized integral membrane protein (TIGR00698 family)
MTAGLSLRYPAVAPGLLLAATIAVAARFVADHYGGPVLLYALLLGMAFNFLNEEPNCTAGLRIASRSILRLGVVLLGAAVTFSDIAALGATTVAIIIAGVVLTIGVGTLIGRAFGLSSDHAALSAGAVAICGASAAMAISAALPQTRDSERNLTLTVVGVTTLSTIAMIFYPSLTRLLGWPDRWAGVFIGATIHDVAQVIGAGYIVSDDAGATAAVVKLMRVALLGPAVLAISLGFRQQRRDAVASGAEPTPVFPLFLLGYAAMVVVNSLGWLPHIVTIALGEASRWCLVIAVAALGVKTSLRDFVAVGPAPIAALAAQTLLLAVFGVCAVSLAAR